MKDIRYSVTHALQQGEHGEIKIEGRTDSRSSTATLVPPLAIYQYKPACEADSNVIVRKSF